MNIKKAKLFQFLKGSQRRSLFSNSLSIMMMLCGALSTAYSQNIGINTTGAAPNSKAILDINADNSSGEKKGLLIPRMTTTERDLLSATGTTTESLLIFNTTTHCFEAWSQTSWVAFGCINCQLPGAFNASAATTVDCSYFTANWTISGGATSYYLDVSTNSSFSSLFLNNVNVSNVVTYLVTGLLANTTYYYRVRAINTCGTTTNSNTIAQATSACPLPLSAGCNPYQVEADYGTFVSFIGKTWITRNLGSTVQASSVDDISNAAAGCYFQFNRSQAYGCDNGGTLSPAWNATPITEDSDWTTVNDPCAIQLGGDWRIPTYTEWVTAESGWGVSALAYTSALKLHYAGTVASNVQTLSDRGNMGVYWTSTQNFGDPYNAIYFYMDPIGGTDFSGLDKSGAFTVRCLK